MSFQEELYYKIEAYLSGELDADETAAFKNQIAADDLLKAEVEKHKVANALIMEQRLLSVKNILQEERVKDSGSNGSFKPFGFIFLAVAAIGIGTSVWILNKKDVVTASDKNTTSSEQIVLSTKKSGKKSIAESQKSTLQDASKYNASEDIGFHKQQIQQVEEHLHTDEKGVLHIDSSFVTKCVEVKAATDVPAQTVSVKTTTPADPCANVTIHASIKSSATCDHQATGNILVLNINGGTKPYAVSISSNSNESVVNGELPKGMYYAVVSDAKGCMQKYSDISITEKECPIDYSFNPFVGETWSIDAYRSAGQLEIYNKGGVLYYQTNLESYKEIEWTGTGNTNQIVPGYYIFVIKYTDGTQRRGSVTIVQ